MEAEQQEARMEIMAFFLLLLRFNEREQIFVNGFGLSSRHAVRKTFVGLKRSILQQLC